ncbi:MAG: hypothetical protein GY822_09150 [Deltaproteobacteria bacterium]|nr:hypothetical protein [Deltaproteobacteria bacterium]
MNHRRKRHILPTVFLVALAATTGCISDENTLFAMGDSITFGFGSEDLGGYRSRLFALAQREGHGVSFVGPRQDGPNTVEGRSFSKYHDGSSGYTLLGDENGDRGIAPRVEQQISWYRPEILLLMAGTNDILQDIDLDNAPSRFAQLIDEVLEVDPEITLER